jgi:hypothetical protein
MIQYQSPSISEPLDFKGFVVSQGTGVPNCNDPGTCGQNAVGFVCSDNCEGFTDNGAFWLVTLEVSGVDCGNVQNPSDIGCRVVLDATNETLDCTLTSSIAPSCSENGCPENTAVYTICCDGTPTCNSLIDPSITVICPNGNSSCTNNNPVPV